MNQAEATSRPDQLAELLDQKFRIPGTDIRFGLDPVIGLVPGVGDWIGGVVSLYFMVHAVVLGGKPSILLRMFLNILADLVIGSVPLLGEIFDVAWKANLRNARLLREMEQNPEELATESRWLLWGLLLLFAALILGTLAGLGWLLSKLFVIIAG